MTHLHVDRHPGADPVLLVHGFASTGALTWEATGWVQALAEAGRGAIVPDLRGHGGSDAPHDPDAYSPDLLAQDLVAVMDELCDGGGDEADPVLVVLDLFRDADAHSRIIRRGVDGCQKPAPTIAASSRDALRRHAHRACDSRTAQLR